MKSINRIQVIQNHLLGNLNFAPDDSLSKYRARGPQFPIKSFHNYYYEIGLEHYEEFYPIFRSIKSFSHENDFRLSKDEKRRKIIKQIAEMKPKIPFTRKNHLENSLRGFVFGKLLFSYDGPFCVRIGVHSTLFIDSILSLGTEKHWSVIDDSYALKVFGCFAMTELAHGSNVSSIGTTATYIPETREFEINTPDTGSTKWWIGGAAHTATKCTVFAQLIVKDKPKGVHAFLIDLRSKDSHKILPNIIIGDCGHKLENDGIDNGFIIFKKYRVPYDSLLDNISQITPEGEFKSVIQKKEKRFGRMLSSLIRGRTSISSSSEANLRHSLTAAIRWSAIRHQFGSPNNPEIPILNYQLTRTRLMPHLSNLFAISSACEIIFLNFDKVKDLMNKDPECQEGVEFHAILSAFKVNTSEWAFNGIHECRKICGGIGYSSHNRFGELLGQQDVNLTWEGDNNVLLQQTSGFIIKQVQKLYQGKKISLESLKFIEVNAQVLAQEKIKENFSELKELLKTLQLLFNLILHKNLVKLQELAGKGEKFVSVWNNSQPYLQELGRVFGIVLMAEQFCKRVEMAQIDIKSVVEKVCQLFIVDKILKYSEELLVFGYFNKEGFEKFENLWDKLNCDVGESAVRIIDAIADEDFMHGIPIGHSDGQAYQRLCTQIESQPDCYVPAPWLPLVKEMLDYKAQTI